MDMYTLWIYVTEHLNELLALAFTGTVALEFTPVIKINPLSYLLKWVGNKINCELKADIREVSSHLEVVNQKVDNNETDRLRYEILDFGNSLKNGRRHFDDEYKHIFAIHEKYKRILAEREMENGVTDVEYKYITDRYYEDIKTKNFL